MNIETVASNLRSTIAGKETLLVTYENPLVGRHTAGGQMAMNMMVEVLKVNIDELKRILADIELCCEKTAADSWAAEPDRSGGWLPDSEIEPWR